MKIRFKIFGADNHRQRESFHASHYSDFSKSSSWTRPVKIWVLNSDKTGTNEYSIVSILAANKDMILKELDGQITDGIFENSVVGKIEEMKITKKLKGKRGRSL